MNKNEIYHMKGNEGMLIIDGHCDTIEKALDKRINLKNEELSINLQMALEHTPMIQTMAAYVALNYKNAFRRAYDVLTYFEQQQKLYSNDLMQVTTLKDIDTVMEEKKFGLLLAIENGSAIEDNVSNVDYFYQKGVRIMSITWNEDNLLGSGTLTKLDNGLTELGEKYIQKLNEKNIIIDVSHSSPKTFWDTVEITQKPIVATHSCVDALCHHPRNLTNEQIKQIAQMNGIIGICYCTQFLSTDGIAGTKEIAKHIAYVANLVGIDYVGLGSDFDGLEPEELPTDLRNIGEIDHLIKALRNIGFRENEIRKIMGENWLRIFKENL